MILESLAETLVGLVTENADNFADSIDNLSPDELVRLKLASLTNGSITGPNLLDITNGEGGTVVTSSTGVTPVEGVVTEGSVPEVGEAVEKAPEKIIVETQETSLLGQGREIAKDLGMFENGQYEKLLNDNILRREGESLFVYDAEGHKIAEVINLEEKAPGLHKWYSAQGHDVKYVFSTIGENKPFSTVSALKEVGIDLDNSTHDVIYFADHASDDHLKGDLCAGDFTKNALIKVDYGTGCEAPAVPVQIVEDVPEVPAEKTPAEVVPTEPASVVETPTSQTIINNYYDVDITIESSSTVEEFVIPVEEPADLHLPPNPAEGIPCDVTVIAHDNSGRLTEMHVDFHEKSGRVLRITGAEDIARYIKDNPAALDPTRMYIGEDGYVYDRAVVADLQEEPRGLRFRNEEVSAQMSTDELPRGKRIFVNDRLVEVVSPEGETIWKAPEQSSYGHGNGRGVMYSGHRSEFGGDPRIGRGMPFEVRGGFYGGQSSFGQSPFGHDQVPPARTGGGYTLRGRRW